MGQQIDLTRQVQGVLPEINGGAGQNAGLRFADAETPTGVIDGANRTFSFGFTPFPATSLILFVNKTLQIQGVDYTLSANVLVMTSAPALGASMFGWYRYQGFNFGVSLGDRLTLTDTMVFNVPAFSIGKNFSENLQMADSFAKILSPNKFEDSMVMRDSVTVFVPTSAVGLVDAITMNDAAPVFLLSMLNTAADQLVMADSLAFILGSKAGFLNDKLAMNDNFAKTLA